MWEPRKEMILLAYVFAASWLVTGAMAAHLPTLLERMGATTVQAIAAAALVGPAQVAARIMRHIHPLVSARLAASMHPMGCARSGRSRRLPSGDRADVQGRLPNAQSAYRDFHGPADPPPRSA
jgi:hypothetical protein